MIHMVKKKERDERSTATGYATLKENQEYFSCSYSCPDDPVIRFITYMRRCCLKECVGDEIIPEVIQPILARSVASILGPVPVQRVEAD